ncbi:MAG: PQQ-binding-like beta-propeller repeat protein [Verrucomicrobiales bacterium]|nr:PQQ-binding-like beta-propeller repeat protein [Verrucomicrobiales bacterium]
MNPARMSGFQLPRRSWKSIGWIALIAVATARAEDWPQFRGPDGGGISATPAPTTWSVDTGTNIAWSREIPGLGHASPIIWKDRVYLTTAVRAGARPEVKIGVYGDGDSADDNVVHQWRLLCLDRATGVIRWDRLGHEAAPREKRHTKASHCNSTPATDGQRVVAIFGSEGLFCFDMEGTAQWKKDLGNMDVRPWNATDLQWSFASSPLLRDDVVYVQCDVLSGAFVAALDARTGQERWRTPRREVPNWCTPALASVAGKVQLVVNGWKELAGYDVADGRQLWTLSGGGDIPVPAPLVAGHLAVFTSAHGKYRPLRALNLVEAKGDLTASSLEVTNAALPWCHPRLGSYMQTPIAVGGTVWSCDWMGVLSCVDLLTGRIHYSERLGSGGQAFTASGIAAGKRLYFASENGDVYVVDQSQTFAPVATNRLGGLCLATPAAVEGTLYFRTTEKLIACGRRRVDSSAP